MSNTPITIPDSGGYIPSVDGIELPNNGFTNRTQGTFDFSTKVITPELAISFQYTPVTGTVGVTETVPFIKNGVKYGGTAKQAALHVVGASFFDGNEFTMGGGKNPYRFY